MSTSPVAQQSWLAARVAWLRRKPSADAVAAGVLAAVTLAVGAWAAFNVRALAAFPPDFDEAAHLLPALQAARDLRRLDLLSFLVHSYRQDQLALYPFFHSWLSLPFFVGASPSLVGARLSSLAYLCVSIWLGYWLARLLTPQPEWRWLAGLVSAGLMAAALPLWAYGSLAYLEAAGLLVSLAALACCARAGPEAAGRPWLVASSLLAAAALLTKYVFGVFVLGGLALAEALGWLVTRRLPATRWLALFGPAAAVAGLWFANPAKVAAFLDYSRAQQSSLPIWSGASLTYYPRVLLTQYAAGPLAVVLLLGGLALTATRFTRHPGARLALGYLLVGLIVLVLVPQKEPRFLYTLAPVALAQAGPAAAWLATRVRQARPPGAWLSGSAAAGLLLALTAISAGSRLAYLPAAQEVVYQTTQETGAAYRWLNDRSLALGERPWLLNSWHLLNPLAATWDYAQRARTDPLPGGAPLASSSLAPEPTAANLAALRELLAAQGAALLVTIDGSPAGSYIGWQVAEPLWAQGALEPVAASEPIRLHEWPEAYRDRVLAGAFSSLAALRQARGAAGGDFTIQLHVYRMR